MPAGTSISTLLRFGQLLSRCGLQRHAVQFGRPELRPGWQLHLQEERLGAELELDLRLALAVGRDESVQQALLDDRRGKPVAGPAEDIDLDRGRSPGEAESAQQPPAGLVVGVGQLAHIHRPGGRIDADLGLRAALDADQARLVGHTLGGGDRQGKALRFGRRQRLLEIDRQADASLPRLGQQDVPPPQRACAVCPGNVPIFAPAKMVLSLLGSDLVLFLEPGRRRARRPKSDAGVAAGNVNFSRCARASSTEKISS